MKKLVAIALLASGLCFGQQFFDQEDNADSNNQENASGFSHDDDQPDMEVDAGNPGDPQPIDGAWFLLPIAGLAVATYYLRKQKKVA